MSEPSNEVVTEAGPPRERPKGALAKALAAAQQNCKPVAKEARNAHYGYKYASSESIISEAKAALAETGLSLLPLDLAVNVSAKAAGERELTRRFLLLHESGESVPLTTCWPIVLEKGRPWDKATAIADTQSLAYLLRDLLLMPRVDAADEMAAQKDQGAEPASAPPPPEGEPAATTQTNGDGITAEQLTQLGKLKDELFRLTNELDPRGRWGRYLLPFKVDTAKALTQVQAADLIRTLGSQIDLAGMKEELARKGA